ncbi:MAG: hypothetical protein IPG75_18995 [Gemmatimonadetes bacterium]|nr:hypothetical protein [Gemmatimonadota bacterium]
MSSILCRVPRPVLAALALCLLVACDSTGPDRAHPRVALLNALARYDDSTHGRRHYCTLSGSWLMPRWPDSTSADTATLYFTRSVFFDTVLTNASPGVQRDTLLASLAVQWVRADATHLTLRLGPPLALDIPGTLDAPGGDTWTGTWGCPATLPFASDSTLLANGYLADSLHAGSLRVTRTTAVD